MIKRILVALDPDQDTPVAMRYAFRLAKRFDAVVTGLAVIDLRNVSVKVGAGGWGTAGLYTGQVWDDLSDSTREVAEKYLHDHNFNYRIKRVAKPGNPAGKILERIKQFDPDMIIMGAHSVSAVQRLTFGSTTHELVSESSKPLFLTP